MMIPFAEYPVRPSMEVGESLAGYIRRFLGANGHRITKDIYFALRTLYRGTQRSAVTAFETLQSMIGDSVILDRSWWLERPPLEGYYGGYPPAWLQFHLNPPSFCPACLKENGFHFALWELPLMKACPLHQCELIRACTTCLSSFSWHTWSSAWLCSCGVSIESMPLAPPKPGALNIAQVLANSSDLILPFHFQKHFVNSERGQYRLNEIYEGLGWGKALRRLFKRGAPRSKSNNLPPQKGSPPHKCEFWECKLLTDTIEQLISRLIRAKKKRFKRKQLLHFALPSEGLVQAQKFVLNSGPGVLQMKIRTTLNLYLADYSLDLRSSLFIWFYENKQSERRTAYMRDFAIWWASLARRIKDIDPAMQHDILTTPPQSEARRLLAEVMVVSILNRLLDASSQHIHVENFSELINEWRIPPVLRDVSDSDELFRRIGLHLLAGSEGEIMFVHDLLLRS